MAPWQPHDDSTKFRRDLGLWQATALIIGSMIGTGIFFFVSPVANYFDSASAILGVWFLGAGIALTGALCLAELAAAYPETGGSYVYLTRAFGPAVGFVYVWTRFLIMQVGSVGIGALAFSGFFADFFQLSQASTAVLTKPIAVAVVAILTFINILGVRFGGLLQIVMTIVKVLCLIAIIAIGFIYWLGLLPSHEVSHHLIPLSSPDKPPWFLGLFLALIPALWTFGGWDESPTVAEEIKDPARNLPRSILFGLGIVCFFYLAVIWAYLAVMSPEEMAASGGHTAIIAMERALGPWSGQAMALVLMISTFGALNAMILTGGRIAFAAGAQQALFGWFYRLHPQTKTPQRGLMIQALLTIAAVVVLEDMFHLLLYTGIPYWGFAGLSALALIVLRHRDPQTFRPFKVWAYPLSPIVFTMASLGMTVAVILEGWQQAAASLVILGIGAVAYLVQGMIVRNSLAPEEV